MKTKEELHAEYLKLCHAMQTGVAFRDDKRDQSPKQLRVGVNSAMCDNTALVRLLIAKGIITEEEHMQAIRDEMEREVERYRQHIAAEKGTSADRIQLA